MLGEVILDENSNTRSTNRATTLIYRGAISFLAATRDTPEITFKQTSNDIYPGALLFSTMALSSLPEGGAPSDSSKYVVFPWAASLLMNASSWEKSSASLSIPPTKSPARPENRPEFRPKRSQENVTRSKNPGAITSTRPNREFEKGHSLPSPEVKTNRRSNARWVESRLRNRSFYRERRENIQGRASRANIQGRVVSITEKTCGVIFTKAYEVRFFNENFFPII